MNESNFNKLVLKDFIMIDFISRFSHPCVLRYFSSRCQMGN